MKAQVTIHASQFPDAVRRDLLESLRTGRLNHKFLYDTVRQTQRWLALHQAYSPSRHDANVTAIYDRGFEAAAKHIAASKVHLIGLGCGGGQKDTRLLRQLKAAGKSIAYTPSDVSTPMVLVAWQSALREISAHDCFPLVCDLASTGDLDEVVGENGPKEGVRLLSFFGMIPNFEPELILPKLATLIRASDWLLFSANLAPGPDYAAGIQKILPQYDNELTREWLLGFLLDLGVERTDGELRFSVTEPGLMRVKRVEANFHFARSRTIRVGDEPFAFAAGDSVRLFFSYRYTPELMRSALEDHRLQVVESWIADSGEEAVFLITRG